MGEHVNHPPATFSEIREYLSYDPISGRFTWLKKSSYRTVVGAIAGRTTARGYVHIEFAKKSYQCHRLAWYFVNGAFPDGIIDHVNGIKDDNRISNLRIADPCQNAWNRRVPKRTTNLPTGVYVDHRNGKFVSDITVRGTKFFLGRFDTVELAAAAYAAASRRFHGDFARAL